MFHVKRLAHSVSRETLDPWGTERFTGNANAEPGRCLTSRDHRPDGRGPVRCETSGKVFQGKHSTQPPGTFHRKHYAQKQLATSAGRRQPRGLVRGAIRV
jgi:hypothetical protein